MPELPEVETIRLQLEKYIVGHKIKDVDVRYGKNFEGDVKNVAGVKIIAVRRFGKALVIDLSNNYAIAIHVKMTGQLLYRGPNLRNPAVLSKKVIGGLEGKHTHIIFYLDKNGKLYYNDIRKFGWIKIFISSELKIKSDFLRKLGFEPVVDENNPPKNPLTPGKFSEILSHTKRAIKIVLMDQSKIAGIGNIYANDALWLARINPKKPADKLNKTETLKLYKAVIKVLKKGIKYKGASENAFVTPDGEEGKYQNYTLVYGHEGEPCKHCHKAKIVKIFLAGRGTYFCPVCQR